MVLRKMKVNEMAKLHFFNVDIAKEYGVNAALIFQNLVFWIKKNEENGNNFRDGTYWTYNSRKQYNELFPYMSLYQINAAFKTLINNGLIITGNFNNNSYNQTLWYALSELGLSKVIDSSIESPETAVGLVDNDDLLFTNNNTNEIANSESYNAQQPLASSSKNGMKSYGEFNNVKLTDVEYEKLVNDYGRTIANDFIDRLDRHIASKGTRYKNHYATLKEWIIRAVNEGKLNVKASKEAEEYIEFVDSIDYSTLST